tara:strand:+ start:8070 stop:8951 length:882 start_codon:yes stop_codon:yes gene_type:complete
MAKGNFEILSDKLAKATLRHSGSGYETISDIQQEIKDGNIKTGRTSQSGSVILYKDDLLAHSEDAMAILTDKIDEGQINSISDTEQFTTFMESQTGVHLSSPDNVSQFVDFQVSQSVVDPNKVMEVLDTSITELLPTQTSRQERIDNFFTEFFNLTGEIPTFDETPPESDFWVLNGASETYLNQNDISLNPTNPGAYITRTSADATENNIKSDYVQSLEWLRNKLDDYLKDIDSTATSDDDDTRPEYNNQSSGHVEIRNLNHAIIIKQEEGREQELAKETEITQDDWGQLYGD